MSMSLSITIIFVFSKMTKRILLLFLLLLSALWYLSLFLFFLMISSESATNGNIWFAYLLKKFWTQLFYHKQTKMVKKKMVRDEWLYQVNEKRKWEQKIIHKIFCLHAQFVENVLFLVLKYLLVKRTWMKTLTSPNFVRSAGFTLK